MHEKLLVALITALTTLPMTTQNKINKNVNKNTQHFRLGLGATTSGRYFSFCLF